MRKCYKLAICICVFMFSFNFISTIAGANEVQMSITCDNPTPVNGEEIVVSVVFTPKTDINISAFRVKLHFDNEKLAYKGLYSDFGYDDFASYVKDNLLTVIYVTTDQGFNMKASVSRIVLELNFKVLQQSNIGTMKLSAQVDGLCNYDAQEIAIIGIEPIDVTVIQAGEANCDLASLTTDGYQITPAFSPDITQYSMDVPYSKSTIEFVAQPLDEDASVKANRKTLKSSGTSTDINLTVSSADKKSKKVYTVTVNRLTKAETKTVDSFIKVETDKTNLSKTSTKNIKKADEDGDDDSNVENSDTFEDSAGNSKSFRTESENTVEMVDSISENNDDNNSLATKLPLPLVVTQGSFNFVLFAVISAIFVAISLLVIKRR